MQGLLDNRRCCGHLLRLQDFGLSRCARVPARRILLCRAQRRNHNDAKGQHILRTSGEPAQRSYKSLDNEYGTTGRACQAGESLNGGCSHGRRLIIQLRNGSVKPSGRPSSFSSAKFPDPNQHVTNQSISKLLSCCHAAQRSSSSHLAILQARSGVYCPLRTTGAL